MIRSWTGDIFAPKEIDHQIMNWGYMWPERSRSSDHELGIYLIWSDLIWSARWLQGCKRVSEAFRREIPRVRWLVYVPEHNGGTLLRDYPADVFGKVRCWLKQPCRTLLHGSVRPWYLPVPNTSVSSERPPKIPRVWSRYTVPNAPFYNSVNI